MTKTRTVLVDGFGPSEDRMTIGRDLSELGFPPRFTKSILQVVNEKIGESLPFSVIQFVSNPNESVSVELEAYNGVSQPVLTLPKAFARFVPIECALQLFFKAGTIGGVVKLATAMFELTATATRTRRVSARPIAT